MSGRGRRVRGRPSKGPGSTNRTNFLRKPKPFSPGDAYFGRDLYIHSTGSASPSYRGRGRGRAAAQKSRNFVSSLIADEQDDDISSLGADPDDRVSDITDLELDNITENLESDDSFEIRSEDEDYASDASLSTVSSSISRHKLLSKHPVTPELIDEDIPKLDLPASATDLIIPPEHVLPAIGIFEVLRHFRTNLRLSPFTFEDFCASLICDEQCTLVAEIHICLLKAIFREEDANSTMFGPQDNKDSINICLFFLDAMTWPEVARAFLDSDFAIFPSP